MIDIIDIAGIIIGIVLLPVGCLCLKYSTNIVLDLGKEKSEFELKKEELIKMREGLIMDNCDEFSVKGIEIGLYLASRPEMSEIVHRYINKALTPNNAKFQDELPFISTEDV